MGLVWGDRGRTFDIKLSFLRALIPASLVKASQAAVDDCGGNGVLVEPAPHTEYRVADALGYYLERWSRVPYALPKISDLRTSFGRHASICGFHQSTKRQRLCTLGSTSRV